MSSGNPYLYVVRCNFFGDQSEECDWNEWYNGPKTAEMLGLPHFVGSQRFHGEALDIDVRYVAVWHLSTPDALATREYKNQWGFAHWEQKVGDWSRDLYKVTDNGPVPGVTDGALLVLRAYSEDDVDRSVLPDAVWMTSIGLDRTWPSMSVEVAASGEVVSVRDTPLADMLVWETAYRPIVGFRRASG